MATNGQASEEIETHHAAVIKATYEKQLLGTHNDIDSIENLLSAERIDSDAERNRSDITITTQNGNHANAETVLVSEEVNDTSDLVQVSDGVEDEAAFEEIVAQNLEEAAIAEDDNSVELILVEEGEAVEDEADPVTTEELVLEGEEVDAAGEEHDIEEHEIIAEDVDSSERVLVAEEVNQEPEVVETIAIRPNVQHHISAAEVPYIELVNGRTVPIIGLGTWLIRSEVLHEVISTAVDLGYRHFDCAHVYQNEEAVGAALRAKIEEGTVTREELFITSKLWATHHRPEAVNTACRKSLEALGFDYLDLYLIHTPFGFKDGKNLLPKIAGVLQYSSYDYLETWYAMEDLVKKGLVRSIGVANFNSAQITRLCSKAKIMPVINQVECHPFLNQKKLTELCRSKGIAMCTYGVLGSPARPQIKGGGDPSLMEDERVLSLAEKYGVSVAQILLRYQIEKENILVPRTSNLEHLLENMAIFNFNLEAEDFEALDNMKRTKRFTDFVGMGDTHKFYPFSIPY